MNGRAVAEMDDAEESHWWYAGLQDLLRRLVRSYGLTSRADLSVLDVGCGTGANLRLLRDCLRPHYLGGFDVRPDCVARAAEKCAEADVYLGDVRRPELHHATYDLVTCCDVISDVDAEECLDGFRRIVERLTPGGRLIMHVPACAWLASEHDFAVGTRRRFEHEELHRWCRNLGLNVEWVGYRMSLLFPFVAASRFLRFNRDRGSNRAKTTSRPPRSDLRKNLGSSLCRTIVQLENAAVARRVRVPYGSSLLAIARR